MAGESFGSVTIQMSADAWVRCSTYPDHVPILSVTAGTCSLSLSMRGKEVGEYDVANARSLAEAVAVYVAEIERLFADQHPVPTAS